MDLTNVADISCGGRACLSRMNDGNAVAWGSSDYGRDASAVNLTNVADISCGVLACVARKVGKPTVPTSATPTVPTSEKPTVPTSVPTSEKPTVPTSEACKNYGDVGFFVVFASFMYHLW